VKHSKISKKHKKKQKNENRGNELSMTKRHEFVLGDVASMKLIVSFQAFSWGIG